MHYEEQKFDIPSLDGISPQTIEEHLKLYSGYVKHVNLIHDKIAEYAVDSEKNAYVLGELQRRLGFEFDGMRNHEYYFSSLAGGAQEITEGGALRKAIEEAFGSYDAWLARFKAIAMMRGIGWAILGYDQHAKKLINYWVDEQQLGHLTGVQPILMLDMWEHSFLMDYTPGQKKEYVEAFFKNLNWGAPEHMLEWSSK